MVSSLAAQLAQLAANSKSILDVKAQRAAHSQSLLFERRDAAGQSFHTIYTICYDGFEELCRLDGRFSEFSLTLFSDAAQEEDRTLMTAEENTKLDEAIATFLHLVASRLRLMPAIKAVEWLIRRFRIHEYNTTNLLTAFLPYHTLPVFVTLMSILPKRIPRQYRFIDPYIKSLITPPRAAIVQHTVNDNELLTTLTTYVLESCRSKNEYPALITFWGGIMAESVNGMLEKTRSGRKAVQLERSQLFASQVYPALSDCLIMKKCPGLQIASYMIVTIIASKGVLDDALLTAFMEQIVQGWTTEILQPALVCLCVLACHRSSKQFSGKLTKALIKIPNLTDMLRQLSKHYRVEKLANGLALSLVDRVRKKGDNRGLSLVREFLINQLLQRKQAILVYKAMLVAGCRLTDEVDIDGHVRKELGSLLVSLSQAGGELGEIVQTATEESELDIEKLEMNLSTAIRPRLAIEASGEGIDVNGAGDADAAKEDWDAVLARLSLQKRPSSNCLSAEPADLFLFKDLALLFVTAATKKDGLAKFNGSPLLSRPQAHKDPFFFSFYMRVWCGPYPTLARANALEAAKHRLKEDDCASLDFQAILPYAIAALGDPARKVRQAAAELVVVLGSIIGSAQPEDRWGAHDVYKDEELVWMDPTTAQAFVSSVLGPSLEESVLDENRIATTLKHALGKTPDVKTDKSHRLSHGQKSCIFQYLCSNVVATPLVVVKVRLLSALNHVNRISGKTRTELLLPAFVWWAYQLNGDYAQKLAANEGLNAREVDAALVDVVVASERKGLEQLLSFAELPEAAEKPSLTRCVFARIQKLWPSLKGEAQTTTAARLLELCQAPLDASSSHKAVSVEAGEVLRNVTLTTDILIDFVESVQEVSQLAEQVPSSKRRRVTKGGTNEAALRLQNGETLRAGLRRMTFILELIHESRPETHPEMFEHLFITLAGLQDLRAAVGSDLGYLQNMVLSSLLAMVPSFKDSKRLTMSADVGHGAILANCIQNSTSPTVINTALLLVASLAKTAPDIVLHSVMPIFAFVGSSVLRQADDYSAHVVNQTICEVIPPLIDTFRRSRRNLVASTMELLSSFVIAYEHIPPHRKRDLFVALVENLGPEDFLFAVLAMFVDKYGTNDNVLSFLMHMMDSFSGEIQLKSLIKLLDLVGDMFKPKPTLSAILLGKHEEGAPDYQKIAFKELALLRLLLGNQRLKKEMSHISGQDDAEAATVLHLYATLLEDLLTLADTVKTNKALHVRCGDALASLLNLLSIGDFIKSVETLLSCPNTALRHKVLQSLELRVDKERMGDVAAQEALLAFLPQLTAVIRESSDMAYKCTAVLCVDKIAEKYGKKDLDAVAAAAETIAGKQCLGVAVQELRVLALLCLASLVDVLQDGFVPVLPLAVPRTLMYLRESLSSDPVDTELHKASFAFLGAVAEQLPYLITGEYLSKILICCIMSAVSELDEESVDYRRRCQHYLAKLVDPKALFVALEKNWSEATEAGFPAMTEQLSMLDMSINKHPKSTIAQNISALSALFFQAFDFKRVRHKVETTSEDVLREDQLETLLNDVALRMVYKLNDATFRPVFAHLLEWTVTGLPKSDKTGLRLRQESVYAFLAHFFGGLKSIVTSYASYILDNATYLLCALDPGDSVQIKLWTRVLRTLSHCFEHDQDGFWQTPAHFSSVAPVLVEQIPRAATNADHTTMLVQAICHLAAAADSRDHHKELNGKLLKSLRAGNALTRKATIGVQRGLTRRLGEEWLTALPEMLPFISELQDDEDEGVERENARWILEIEDVLGESLDAMLQ